MNLKKITNQHLLLLLLSASIFALALAYISQYFFGLDPCILCLYQRKPFFIVIALTTLTLLIPYLKRWQKSIIIVSVLIILANAFLAAYHVGVEEKIFRGPTNCSDVSVNITDIEELKAELAKDKIVRCDEPSFLFLGISMAGWNIIYCLGLVILVIFIMLGRINAYAGKDL